MDNHQIELATALAKDEYLLWTVPKKILKVLSSLNLKSLKPYPAVDSHAFPKLVDQMMGF